MLNAVNLVYLFEPHESPCYACGVRNVLTLVHFYFWIQILDGYQMTVGMRTTQKISRFESTSWLSLCWSYHVRELSFICRLCCIKLSDVLNVM
jgi:hypothetical protein